MNVSQIKLSYDQKQNHLDGVTTTIEKGKITTIIGPNGCGKTTLLSVISRNNMPQQGSVTLEQKDIMTYKAKEFAKKLAIVYQQNSVPQDITIEKLVAYGRVPHQQLMKKNVEEDKAAVNWALAATNLTQKRTCKLDALSGGERQRVWIAMALAQKSSILCLDEPTTYLDIFYQIELMELVKKLNKEHALTIVMVLHDINQAIKYSDHIILMKDGKILCEGAPIETVTAERMKEVYGVEVIIQTHESVGTYMIPLSI
ncbi:ABC transporter ATP-binding protein [Lysinibacillus sp. FSL W8-0953]|uniref:ABC transporter ATP-binding protein n=1 Tax=Lysinibacillus sp. FSL W8-0953 TaxID=2954640 RepID=UPI0030F6CE1D